MARLSAGAGRRAVAAWLLAVAAPMLAGCSEAGSSGSRPGEVAPSTTAASSTTSDPTASGGHADGHEDGHDHSHDGVSLLVGDGTRASEVGYTLRDVRLPSGPGQPGEVSFEIERFDGSTVTEYLPDHTKDLHLYVVRSDLAVFRHLHPTMAEDGRWSGAVNLPEPGDYRVVAEFVARDESGRGDHVMLGRSRTVPGDWQPAVLDVGASNDDGVVAVRAEPGATSGPGGRLDLVVSDLSGAPVSLGTHLGAEAHVVGFAETDGAAAHLHPAGAGTPGPGGTTLTFATDIERPGSYLFYVQVRVEDFLHTVPVRVDVAAPA